MKHRTEAQVFRELLEIFMNMVEPTPTQSALKFHIEKTKIILANAKTKRTS